MCVCMCVSERERSPRTRGVAEWALAAESRQTLVCELQRLQGLTRAEGQRHATSTQQHSHANIISFLCSCASTKRSYSMFAAGC